MGSRALVVCLVALAACDKTTTVTRHVNLNVVPSCGALPDRTFGQYVATGDYEPPFPNQSQLVSTDQPAPIDGVPADVRSLALDVEVTPPWLGVTLVPPAGDLDMLLLPSASACSLVGSAGFDPGMVFAAVSSRTLLATGATNGKGLALSVRVDLDTGRVAQLTNPIGTPRLRAATAILGDGRAIVTGGISNGVAVQSAEIFDEASDGFQATQIFLQQPRADHGAVVLANGDVLLVGGDNAGGPIAPTERIHFDGTSWRTNEGTTLPLPHARAGGSVLRLADGTILVGGGGVPQVDFFSADATSKTWSFDFHTRAHEAYAALDGGGALYVAAPDAGDPPDFQRAWFVSASGATPIVPDVTAPLSDVKLFPSSGGGAMLWTGSAWLAFDPWRGFVAPPSAPSAGPSASSPIASPDPGLRAWIDPDGSVSVWRSDVRNVFATDATYLTNGSGTSMLAPDSFPPPAFDPTTGLELGPGQSVFVADARYGDVAIDVDGLDSPPVVVLRDGDSEIEVGGTSCPYPPTSGKTHVHVERTGAFVSYALGWMLEPCTTIAPGARVSAGIRGGNATLHALDFSVTRADEVLH